MILLLDTTVLIDVVRDRNDRRHLLVQLVNGGRTLSTSSVNIGEIYAGLRKEEEVDTEDLISELVVYEVTGSIAKAAGNLKRSFAVKGRTHGLIDMIVAATAIEHGLTLMTDNLKDFPIPELKLYPMP